MTRKRTPDNTETAVDRGKCGHCTTIGLCVVVVGILLGSQILRGAETKTYVFSDVRHIADVDDYVGTEIVVRVQPGSTKVTGQWDLYQGYDPLTMSLDGTLVGSRLEMKGSNPEWRPALSAMFSGKSLNGTLTWYIGHNLQSKKIRLRRVQGRLQDLRSGGAPHQ